MTPEFINLFVGFDPNFEAGYHTFVSSVLKHSSLPVHITPIGNALFNGLINGKHADEATDFSRVRFLIPWMMNWTGSALFCDGVDMVVRADIAELWAMRDAYKAVQVVQHDYRTLHPRKFVGTLIETENRDYPGKNWSSLMILNCSHFDWRDLIPEVVKRMPGADLQRFEFIREKNIGALPVEWNWLCQELGPNPEAKLLHFTAGIPAFPHYAESPMADEWARAALNVGHVTL